MTSRRSFLKHGVALAGGAFLLRPLGHASEPTSPAENSTLKTIQGLRTIHGNFTAQPIPDETLQTILQASVRTASASNNQSYSIVVVKDPKLMRSVCGYRGACMLVYCADYTRLTATAASLGHTYAPGTIVDFVNALINTTLAVQTAVIAARSLGVDSLITNGVHRGDLDRHWKLLGLPEKHCFPVLAVVLGYAAAEPKHRTGRLAGTGVIHPEKYHVLTADEISQLVQAYDDKDRHLGLNDDWAEKGHKHYLDWYFTEWAGRAGPAPAETPMLNRLKRSGFIEGFRSAKT